MIINYRCLPNIKETSSGVYVWESKDIPQIMDIALKNRWIVLGGDVLTSDEKYTYDNWYYAPEVNTDILENVKQSIDHCMNYVHTYETVHEEKYLYSIVLSNSFTGSVVFD